MAKSTAKKKKAPAKKKAPLVKPQEYIVYDPEGYGGDEFALCSSWDEVTGAIEDIVEDQDVKDLEEFEARGVKVFAVTEMGFYVDFQRSLKVSRSD